MNQDHDDHDEHRGLIVDDEALDYILYEEITKQDREQKDGKCGCFGMVVLLLLPAAIVMLLCWR